MSDMAYQFDAEKAYRELFEMPSRKEPLKLGDLHVYQLADELSDRVWEIVARWDYFAKKTVGDQWVRAADSVGANIAEGYGRYFFQENVLFLYYSRGSLMEARWWLAKARKRNLVRPAEGDQLSAIMDQLVLELNKVIKMTKAQDRNWKSRRQ